MVVEVCMVKVGVGAGHRQTKVGPGEQVLGEEGVVGGGQLDGRKVQVGD